MVKLKYLLLATSIVLTGCATASKTLEPELATSNTVSNKRYKATMKPYIRRGKVIRPKEVALNQEQLGKASWYGPGFQGRVTSSGERYNMYAFTAAHKTLPLGTIVKVENLKNGKSVIVRINDRGPFVKGRVIDCSYAAACKIGLNRDGVAPVKLTVIDRAKINS